MTRNFGNIAGVTLLCAGFYFASMRPSFAYLDPGSGSMMLTTILGVFAATAYTLKGYLGRITALFRKSGPRTDGNVETRERPTE